MERRPRFAIEGLIGRPLARVGDGSETSEYMLGEGVPAESIRGMTSTWDTSELGGIDKGGNDL